jgi:hypothetical protein
MDSQKAHPVGAPDQARLAISDSDTFEEVLRHFDDLDPIVVTIIKGHLVLEQHLNASVARLMQQPDVFPKARLTFTQKTVLLRALCGNMISPNFWPLLERLNALRNAVAHRLDKVLRNRAIDELRAAAHMVGDDISGWDDTLVVKGSVAFCYGQLEALGFVFDAMQEGSIQPALLNLGEMAKR